MTNYIVSPIKGVDLHICLFQQELGHLGLASANRQMDGSSTIVIREVKVDTLFKVPVEGRHLALKGREQQRQILLLLV